MKTIIQSRAPSYDLVRNDIHPGILHPRFSLMPTVVPLITIDPGPYGGTSNSLSTQLRALARMVFQGVTDNAFYFEVNRKTRRERDSVLLLTQAARELATRLDNMPAEEIDTWIGGDTIGCAIAAKKRLLDVVGYFVPDGYCIEHGGKDGRYGMYPADQTFEQALGACYA